MKTTQTTHPILTLVALCGISAHTHGAELFADAFAYAEGPVVGAPESLWTAHSQAGNGPVSVQAGRLELRSERGEDINAPLAGGPFTADGEVSALYAQFQLEATALPSESGTYFAHFRSGNAHRARLWISTAQAAEGHYRLGIGNSSGADADSGPFPLDLQTHRGYRVVFRYELATGLSSLAIDPASESDLSVTAADPVGLSNVSSIALRQSAEIGILWIDDLVVSDRFPGPAEESHGLEIMLQPEGLAVRWPIQATNHVLQSTLSLDAPNWLDEEEGIVESDPWRILGVPGQDGSRFFRLRQR
jgi:hypothetical protein